MSRTDDSVRDLRDQVSPDARDAAGQIRRFDLGVTSGVKWQVIGHTLLDGRKEVRPAEVFSGIGFFSRPKESNNAEAIGVFVGGAANPMIAATRDEDLRKSMVPAPPTDMAAMFNSSAIAQITGSTMEVRLAGGTVQPTILGTTYRSAEDTLLTALGAFATSIGGAVPGQAAAAATLNTAITTFKAAAATYLTQVLKAQ